MKVEIDNSEPLPERPICCLKLERVPGKPEGSQDGSYAWTDAGTP